LTFITEQWHRPPICQVAQDFPPGAAFLFMHFTCRIGINNCGYSLFSDNLMSYRGDWIVNLTVMGLIVLGGIGFIVQHEFIGWFRGVQKKVSLIQKSSFSPPAA